MTRRLSPEALTALTVAIIALLLHLVTNRQYGYFRDELYFIACARHLDFGYVDFAPLSALLLRVELIIFGTSLAAVRLLPAVASALTMALTGAMTREFGGRVWSVVISCIAALCSLIYLGIGNFYSLNVYEPLLWTGCAFIAARIINGGPAQLWLWFGLIAGMALGNKHSAAFFLGALALAIALTPLRQHLTRPWIWLGAAIAALIALPNIIWQIKHGWPTWVLLQNVERSQKNVVLTPVQFIAQQITLMNPSTLPVWFGGLIWLFASRDGRRFTIFGLAYVIALGEFIVLHGKNYYLAPAYPMLFAAGGVAWEGLTNIRLQWLRPILAALMILSAGVLAPVVLPLLSPQELVGYMRRIHFEPPRTETSHTAALPQLFADQFGWEEMVRSVAAVYRTLSAEEQQRAAIFCQNYGQAGAMDFFGPRYGLPPAISGHQNYYLWGPGKYTGDVMIILDDNSTDEQRQFSSVEDRGLVKSSPWAMPWEQRQHILLCRGLRGTLRDLWPQLREWL